MKSISTIEGYNYVRDCCMTLPELHKHLYIFGCKTLNISY